ncbi:MAG: toxin-activating lysine-acyltransferase, partial [Rhodobacteraceae bacterium]|nr:toxin-activating lysine-acyltransferase [Paracoccaceae bacterium]
TGIRPDEGAEKDRFFRAAMRHFEELRSSGPTSSLSPRSFPRDWFDLPEQFLSDFGAIFYLASLTTYHRGRSLADLFAAFESPLRLGQYRIFRSGGFARAIITWAGLAPAPERRFAIDHQPLRPEDWNSGSSRWLVDFISPFGHIDQIVPQLSHNRDITHVRTLWHNRDGGRYRIVEWSRPPGHDAIKVRSYGVRQFARILEQEVEDGNS